MNSPLQVAHLKNIGSFAFAFTCVAHQLLAATNHWFGGSCETPVVGSCNWSSAQNWVEMTTPANDGSADIVFLGDVGLTPELHAIWNVNSITFDTTAGSFTCGSGSIPSGQSGANTLTIESGGIVNNSLNVQTMGSTGDGYPIILGAAQTWSASLGNLVIPSASPVFFNGKDLTLLCVSNISIFPKISGSGRLIKAGAGTLFLGQGGAFNTGFTGSVVIVSGVLEIDGSQTIERAASLTLSGGALVLNRQNSIGSSSTAIIFNGGHLQAMAPNTIVNPSDFFCSLIISNNSSAIDLAPADTNSSSGFPISSVLTFNGGVLAGSGSLTINGWTGMAGVSGADDRIFITNALTAAFLNAIQFAGFPPGAMRLSTGEIVPTLAATWNGLGSDDNWSTGGNWAGGFAPSTNAFYNLTFGGSTRLTPFTDTAWNVGGIAFATTAGSFTNSGATINNGTNGIINNSTHQQSIRNNIVMAGPQTWLAGAGPLSFAGSNDNGGFTLTIDGASNVSLEQGGGLSGAGGLVKNGSGTLILNAPLTFTGDVTLTGGQIQTPTNNAFNGQNLTFHGGTLSDLSSTQTFGALLLAANSTINLDPGHGKGLLAFSSASVTGGTLTINGWTGTGGQAGTDDKITIGTAPDAAVLSAVRFTGFSPGAVYLPATGEIVPPGGTTGAPTLTMPSRPSLNTFQFSVMGSSGQSYTIQFSTTLTNWVNLLTTNAPGNVFTFTDSNATNGYGFYRILANP